MEVPYYDIRPQQALIKEAFLKKVSDILDSGQFVLGPEVEAFEHAFAAYCGLPHAVAFSNGTTALHVACKLLGIGPGDEVITTPFTFAASSWAISYVGARPVYVDIDPQHFTINPACIEAAITKNTKAVLIVHLYGHPCDMEAIHAICQKHQLRLIEDAAQAHGAYCKGQKVGAWGDVTAFSFYPTKNLGTCGEGGALVMADPSFAEAARLLRNHGSRERYYHEAIGYNYRMEALQGAYLNLKLPYLENWNAQRRSIAQQYHAGLAHLPLQLPLEAPWAHSVYHLYTLRVAERPRFLAHLKAQGIGHAVHYPRPLHLQPCYAFLGYPPGSFPEAERAAEEVVSLPLFPCMTSAQVERVITVIQSYQHAHS